VWESRFVSLCLHDGREWYAQVVEMVGEWVVKYSYHNLVQV